MATLQKIRTKAGLLVAIVIGVSLAAFILGDMLQGGSSMFQRNRLEVGVIDGESIQYPDFQKEVEQLGELMKQNYQTNQLDDNMWAQVREQAWQKQISDIVMGDVYDKLGINVSSDELFDMLQGSNIHPIVQQIFRNPETGQFDRASVVRFLKALETGVSPDQRAYWLNLEEQIVDERTQSKYANMVGKGLYVTSEEAQMSAAASGKTVNFDYISLPYSSVSDDQIEITEKDLKDYYAANQKEYKTETSRRIEYIVYPVTPSQTDYADAEKWINDIKSDFEKAEDNVQFVNANSDVPFENLWYKADNLPENIAKWIFEDNAEVGDVFGPYEDGDAAFTLAKLHKSEMMPDSVEARHILLAVNSQAELLAAQALADSLKAAIENGADFAQLARENSTDQGSAVNGGDLGWFQRNMMVKPFEEAAFNNKKGEVTIVTTQFGIHIVQTTDRGKLTQQVQVAYLTRNVIPSTKTYQDTYAQASKFAGENTSREAFDEAVTAENLVKRAATLGENERMIAGLENARILVRAAYEAEQNDILKTTQGSPIFELGDNFVIAVLTNITEEGASPFEQVRARVELAVAKEKKAEYLADKVASAMSAGSGLSALAAEMNTEVKTANNINFNSFSIPGVGVEPSVIGTATNLSVDKVSSPIEGNNGVFVVMVTSETSSPAANIQAEQNRLAQTLNYRAASQAFQTHKNSVEIVDKRAKFY